MKLTLGGNRERGEEFSWVQTLKKTRPPEKWLKKKIQVREQVHILLSSTRPARESGKKALSRRNHTLLWVWTELSSPCWNAIRTSPQQKRLWITVSGTFSTPRCRVTWSSPGVCECVCVCLSLHGHTCGIRSRLWLSCRKKQEAVPRQAGGGGIERGAHWRRSDGYMDILPSHSTLSLPG